MLSFNTVPSCPASLRKWILKYVGGPGDSPNKPGPMPGPYSGSGSC
jgi:hypothetical protein